MLQYRNSKNAAATAKYWSKSLDSPDWYSLTDQNGDLEVMIYDVIGWPFNDANDLVREFASNAEKNITVRINSPGGDVFDGLAIYHALKAHRGHVTTRIEGLAASMASVIALSGDEVTAYKSTMYMIHEPWAVVGGNRHVMRECAGILDKMTEGLFEVYQDKARGGKKELRQMMQDETWQTAEEAKEYGFIDTVITGTPAKAAFDLSMFANAPNDLIHKPEGRELNEREIERALRDAGASRSFAKSLVAGNYKALRDAELHDEAKTLITKIMR